MSDQQQLPQSAPHSEALPEEQQQKPEQESALCNSFQASTSLENSCSSSEQLMEMSQLKASPSSLDSSAENSGDEQSVQQLMQQLDEETSKRQEEQDTRIIELLRLEFERKEKEKERKQAVQALFKDQAERDEYGVKDKTIRYLTRSIKSYKKELRIRDHQLKEEADLIKVEDTWLKLTKMMFEPFRLNFQNERLEQYKLGDPVVYLEKTLIHIQKKRDITIRAGEMICVYLDLDPMSFLYNRADGDPTIIEFYDPIQFMIPTPKASHAIPTIDKQKSADILRQIVLQSAQQLKDNQEIVKLRKSQFQSLYHFLIEDNLWMEYDMDFEDFKQTLMAHGVLGEEEEYELVKMIYDTDQDLQNYFAERLQSDSD